jgi:hypothetical protein
VNRRVAASPPEANHHHLFYCISGKSGQYDPARLKVAHHFKQHLDMSFAKLRIIRNRFVELFNCRERRLEILNAQRDIRAANERSSKPLLVGFFRFCAVVPTAIHDFWQNALE